jgi:hypothetical protein
MDISQKPQFLQELTKAMSAYSKPLPEKALLTAWWETLRPFPLQVVALAFAQYCDENGEFAPVPAGIAKRCKLLDGRPGDEEAWASALLSRNEAATVVWTSETAEAFAIVAPILQVGDEIGARMAFKAAYNRLVASARASMKPAVWSVSLGWDIEGRKQALENAVAVGRLPAPQLIAIAGPSQPEEVDLKGLERLKVEMAKLVPASARRAAEREAEREAEARKKQEISKQVIGYLSKRTPKQANE